jgi:hypothetical protein
MLGRTLVLPLAVLAAFIATKAAWSDSSLGARMGRAAAYLAILAGAYRLVGLHPGDLPQEVRRVLSLLRSNGPS